jgi:hypothetical protein
MLRVDEKRWTILFTPITAQDDIHVEQIFISYCIVHNIILDYNGADDWRERTLLVRRKGEDDDEPVVIAKDI